MPDKIEECIRKSQEMVNTQAKGMASLTYSKDGNKFDMEIVYSVENRIINMAFKHQFNKALKELDPEAKIDWVSEIGDSKKGGWRFWRKH